MPTQLLDTVAFDARLLEEGARIRRHGGFLTLALIARRSASAGDAPAPSDPIAEALTTRVRAYDVVGARGPVLSWLMPDTDMTQAGHALERLLGLQDAGRLEGGLGPGDPAVVAGLATTYGELPAGVESLVQAAKEALAQAAPGCYRRSATLDGRPRVLVIDDDLTFAQALAEAVSEQGWDGRVCPDPDTASEWIRDGVYSALFIDLVMPHKSGADLLRESLLHRPGRPVVLMTGHDNAADVVIDALSVGGPVTFLKKPMTGAEIAEVLEMFRSLLPGVGTSRPRRG
jgi:ActR/RegA family two-component response regulator